MSEVPVQIVVAAFDEEEAAGQALDLLKEAKRERLVGIENAAVLRKDDKGKLHIKETADMGGGKGAAIGGAIGAGVGLIAGAALAAPVVVGGLIGGLAAKLRDSGFSDDRLEVIGESLKPGQSAIIAVVEHTWVAEVEAALEEAEADMVTESLAIDIADQLEEHHATAYSALQAEGGLAAGRIAVGDEEAEGAVLTVAGEEIAGSEFVATNEGVVVTAAAAGPDGAVAGVAAAAVDEEEE